MHREAAVNVKPNAEFCTAQVRVDLDDLFLILSSYCQTKSGTTILRQTNAIRSTGVGGINSYALVTSLMKTPKIVR